MDLVSKKAKKKLVSVVDGFRIGPNSTAGKCDLDIKESLSSDHFALAKIVRHGFPHDPKCMAYDPVQKLLAIGNQTGAIRIFGRPGVECLLQHESTQSVIQLQFLVNEGALVSACKDDCVHLWNFRQKKPEIVQSLQFQKERVTCIFLPFQSKWLYVGTDKGNVRVVNIESFSLSGYVIFWNKAIDISQKNHPGCVKHLSDCPSDDGKLLIGFEKGTVVLWDLKKSDADSRFQCEQGVKGISWHFDGRQFVCCHGDGSLSIWNTKKPQEPFQCWAPHSRGAGGSRTSSPQDAGGGEENSKQRERCRPITQDESGVLPAVTVLRGGKSATVLEMEHQIVSFVTLCVSPYPHDFQEPFAVAVLLKNDFLIVDLSTTGYPCFENPYPMDVHETAVTCCAYLVDCPTDLIAAYYSVGSKQKRQGFSDKPWPITGGEWGSSASGNPELIITGHSDGSLKFWDASSENLQVLYKLKTGRHIERPDDSLPRDFEPFAVEKIAICPESRCLAVAGRGAQVTLFRFTRSEAATEVPVLEVPIIYSTGDETVLNDVRVSRHKSGELERQNSVGSFGSNSSTTSEGKSLFYPLKVRGGPQKRPAGYQPDCVCLTGWLNPAAPEQVTALEINSFYGLLVYGTGQGIAVVDMIQHVLVLTMGTPDLYGASDPYTRTPKVQFTTTGGNGGGDKEKQCNSDPEPLSPVGAACATASNVELAAGTELSKNKLDAILLPSEEELNGIFKRCYSEGRNLRKKELEIGRGLLVDDERLSQSSVELAREATKDCSERMDSKECSFIFNARPNRQSQEALLSLEGVECLDVNLNENQMEINKLTGEVPRKPSLTRLKSAPISGSVEEATADLKEEEGAGAPDVGGMSRIDSSENDASCEALDLPSPLPPPRRAKAVDFQQNTADVKRSQSVRVSSRVKEENESQQKSLLKGLARRFSSRHQRKHQSSSSHPFHKDKELSRSRSSSVSSVDTVISSEGITFLTFIESCTKKNEAAEVPTIWIGTMRGSLLALGVTLPVESRLEESVFVSPLGFRLKCHGKVLCANFLDQNFNLLAPPVDSWKDMSRDSDRPPKNRSGKTLCFSGHGNNVYMCSPSEIQKFTISSEMAAQLSEVLGDLFQGIDMPEPPKQGFFSGVKVLLSGGSQSLDREELFGASSGKPSGRTAVRIPGPNAIDPLRAQSGSAASEVAKTKMALIERGEKLGEIEERTAMLSESAKAYSDHASELASKFKNKKWYHI